MRKSIILLLTLFLCACSPSDMRSDDIVILFTNDIHCQIDKNISLASVAAYKEYLKTKTKYVALVDCGDMIQGTPLGLASKGEMFIDVMNKVGYDFAVFGNHEFDYGLEQLSYLLDKANATYLNCNISYLGNKENNLLTKTKPYEIVNYGKIKVAYIGISTPETESSASSDIFKENEEFVYDFCTNETVLYQTVQNYVDEVRSKGADIVIALAHLGISGEETIVYYPSIDLIKNTNGIDVLLDGHSHSLYQNLFAENKDGEYVTIVQTGQELKKLGQLTIDEKGLINITLIDDIPLIDHEIENDMNQLKDTYNSLLNKVICTSNFSLSQTDDEGVRMIRNRETTIGDFVADAYRTVAGADIAWVGASSIKDDLNKGDVTLGNLISINPYSNKICISNISGQELLDVLEFLIKDVQKEYKEQDHAIGENSSFPSISGFRFKIDTTKQPTIITDEFGALLSIEGERKIKEIEILKEDKYVPINPKEYYAFASNEYLLMRRGSGCGNIFTDDKIITSDIMLDYEALATYLTDYLHGDLSAYETTSNRIIVQ